MRGRRGSAGDYPLSVPALVRDFVIVNRIPETIGYNVTYLSVGIALAAQSSPLKLLISNWWMLSLGFVAVMVSKMQASVADVIHDRELDRDNPEKSRIPAALDRLGIEVSASILVAELIAGMALWGWIAGATGSPLPLAFGTGACLLGFVYTYPPRLKERGIVNHLTTTIVDVGCVAVFYFLAGGQTFVPQQIAILAVVFCYSFGYHIAHQAADTYYDRLYGISTFTQTVGIRGSVVLAAGVTALGGVLCLLRGFYLAGGVVLFFAFCYLLIAIELRDATQQAKSDRVARRFNIGLWATILNAATAVSLALA